MKHSIQTVAIVGAGRMGQRHVQAAQQVGFRVIGIADLDIARARDLAHDMAVPSHFVFSSVDDLLRHSRPDALVVATTADSHYTIAQAAIDASINFVLVEKPFTTSVSDAEKLLAQMREHNIHLAVNHQVRFTERYLAVKDLLANEFFGEALSMIVGSGNIGLAMGASHYLDFFQLVAESGLTSVQFVADQLIDPNPRGTRFTDQAGRLFADSSTGMRLFMDFGSRAGHGLHTLIITEFGQISIDDLTGRVTWSARYATDHRLPRTRYGLDGLNGELNVSIESATDSTIKVWQSVLNGSSSSLSRAGTDIVKILAAAELSGRLGGSPVSVNDARLLNLCFPWP